MSRPAAEVTDVVVEIAEPLEMQLATSLMGRIAKVTPQGQRLGVKQGQVLKRGSRQSRDHNLCPAVYSRELPTDGDQCRAND